MWIIILVIIIIVCFFCSGILLVESIPNYNKVYFEHRKTYKVGKEGTIKGVVTSGKYFYVIKNNAIEKYRKYDGTMEKSIKTPYEHLSGGVIYDELLYVTFNPPGKKNKVITFTLDLDYMGTIPLEHEGSLTWIDNYNGSWYGVLAHFEKNVNKTRLVKFKNGSWDIERTWYFPTKVYTLVYPYSIIGGQFNRHSGKLFVTGQDKKEIYMINVNEDDELSDKLKLSDVISVPFSGQGVSWDSNYLYGTNSKLHEVVVVKLVEI